MSCHLMSCHVTSCHEVSCKSSSCTEHHVMSYFVLSWQTQHHGHSVIRFLVVGSCDTRRLYVMLHHFILCVPSQHVSAHAARCQNVQRYVGFRLVMLPRVGLTEVRLDVRCSFRTKNSAQIKQTSHSNTIMNVANLNTDFVGWPLPEKQSACAWPRCPNFPLYMMCGHHRYTPSRHFCTHMCILQ